MDTSETYIKMCEKAEEIQKWGKDYDRWTGEWKFIGDVWLPRQDQLQEMASYPTTGYLVPVFAEFVAHYPEDLTKMSMEQLWLAFVMKEKYNKVWTGEKWE